MKRYFFAAMASITQGQRRPRVVPLRRIQRLFAFFLSYLLLRALIWLGLESLESVYPPYRNSILWSYSTLEMPIQILSLILAMWSGEAFFNSSSLFRLVSRIVPSLFSLPRRQRLDFFKKAWNGFFVGFAVTSLCAGLSVFFGFFKFEQIDFSLPIFMSSAPPIFLQGLLIALWLRVVLEFRFYAWSSCTDIWSKLLCIIFQGHLFYSLVSGGAHNLFEKVFFLAASLFLSAVIFLWFENADRFKKQAIEMHVWQYFVCFSVCIALFCVYGFPLGNHRPAALFFVFEAISGEAISPLSESGFGSEILTVIFLSIGAHFIVWRAKRLSG